MIVKFSENWTLVELEILHRLLAKLDRERHTNYEIGMKACELRLLVGEAFSQKIEAIHNLHGKDLLNEE